MPGGLLTDLYELNMAASYLRRFMTGQATFSLFVRALPSGRGFLVAAGLADCLRFLEDFSFTEGSRVGSAAPAETSRRPDGRCPRQPGRPGWSPRPPRQLRRSPGPPRP